MLDTTGDILSTTGCEIRSVTSKSSSAAGSSSTLLALVMTHGNDEIPAKTDISFGDFPDSHDVGLWKGTPFSGSQVC